MTGRIQPMTRPVWWSWDLEISAHVLKRMADRGFDEVDLRTMLHDPSRTDEDWVEGRWVVESHHHGRVWHVILEPDENERVLVVVTAYPKGS